jgi:hypothetical protein
MQATTTAAIAHKPAPELLTMNNPAIATAASVRVLLLLSHKGQGKVVDLLTNDESFAWFRKVRDRHYPGWAIEGQERSNVPF